MTALWSYAITSAYRPQSIATKRFRAQHIEGRERFVHVKQFGFDSHRPREPYFLSHTAGQLALNENHRQRRREEERIRTLGGRMRNQRAESRRLNRAATERAVFGDDTHVPRAAGRCDRAGDEVREQ